RSWDERLLRGHLPRIFSRKRSRGRGAGGASAGFLVAQILDFHLGFRVSLLQLVNPILQILDLGLHARPTLRMRRASRREEGEDEQRQDRRTASISKAPSCVHFASPRRDYRVRLREGSTLFCRSVVDQFETLPACGGGAVEGGGGLSL